MRKRPLFEAIVYALMTLTFVFCFIVGVAGWMQGNPYSGMLALLCALFIMVSTWAFIRAFISGDWP